MTGTSRDTRISKRMSWLLRHGANEAGVYMDRSGWVSIVDVLDFLNKKNDLGHVDESDITRVVMENDKQRFKVKDGKIRANQGHSLQVNLGLKPIQPPDVLYHGTADRFITTIMEAGIEARGRQHVHLSTTIETAIKVGRRHGKPIVLEIMAGLMSREGHDFFLSDNGIWLVNHVPPRFIKRLTNLVN